MIAAAVDIGTNSVKLTVGKRAADGNLTVLFDGVRITRLGQGVDQTRQLHPDAIRRTLAALQEFAEIARNHGAIKIAAVGTSALRDATNGIAFIAEAEAALGGTVEVISGEREAALVFQAAVEEALTLAPDAELIAATDIGGGSTEVILGTRAAVQFQTSLQIGAVRLTEQSQFSDPPTEAELDVVQRQIETLLQAIPAALSPAPLVVIASGGTAATLAAIVFAEAHPEQAITLDGLHGMRVSGRTIREQIGRMTALTLEKRRQMAGLEPARADVIVAGALLQERLLAHWGAEELRVSVRGLRFGLLYQLLSTGYDRIS